MEKGRKSMLTSLLAVGASMSEIDAQAYTPDLVNGVDVVDYVTDQEVVSSITAGGQEAAIARLTDLGDTELRVQNILSGGTDVVNVPGLAPGDYPRVFSFDNNSDLRVYTALGMEQVLRNDGSGWSSPALVSSVQGDGNNRFINPVTGAQFYVEDTGPSYDTFYSDGAPIAEDQSADESSPVEMNDGRIAYTRDGDIWVFNPLDGSNRAFILRSDLPGMAFNVIYPTAYNHATDQLHVVGIDAGFTAWTNLTINDLPRPVDVDGDGYTPDQGDCNDADATVNPASPLEAKDCVDNNPQMTALLVNGQAVQPGSPVLVAAGQTLTLGATLVDVDGPAEGLTQAPVTVSYKIYSGEDLVATAVGSGDAQQSEYTVPANPGVLSVVCVVENGIDEARVIAGGHEIDVRGAFAQDAEDIPDGTVLYGDPLDEESDSITIEGGEVSIVGGEIVLVGEGDFSIDGLAVTIISEGLEGEFAYVPGANDGEVGIHVLGGAAYPGGARRSASVAPEFHFEITGLVDGTLTFLNHLGDTVIIEKDGVYDADGLCVDGACLPEEDTAVDTDPEVDTDTETDTPEVVTPPDKEDVEDDNPKGCDHLSGTSSPGGARALVAAAVLALLGRRRRA